MDSQYMVNAKSNIINTLNSAKKKLISYTLVTNQQSNDDTTESDVINSQIQYQTIERLFIWFQRIVLWHEPLNSIVTIFGILSSFLLLVLYEPRFYATVLIATFTYNLAVFWFGHIWPEIRVPHKSGDEFEKWTHLHPQLLTISEFKEYIEHIQAYILKHFNELAQNRTKNPCKFYPIVFISLLFTAIIGKLLTGLQILSITRLVSAFKGITDSRIFDKSRSILFPCPKDTSSETELLSKRPSNELIRRRSSEACHLPYIIEEEANVAQDAVVENDSDECLKHIGQIIRRPDSDLNISADSLDADLDDEDKDGFVIL